MWRFGTVMMVRVDIVGVVSCFRVVCDMKKHYDMKFSCFLYFSPHLCTLGITSGRVGIGGYQWISMDLVDFGDFMKSDSTIMTGMLIQSCSGQSSPSKTFVSEAFGKV